MYTLFYWTYKVAAVRSSETLVVFEGFCFPTNTEVILELLCYSIADRVIAQAIEKHQSATILMANKN